METRKPLAIELFSGCFGWGAGLVAEGYRVVGFDLYDMCKKIGVPRPDGCQLVLQDCLTIHGKQFKDAALLVASPPCQEFSFRAQPWKRGKAQVPDVLPEWWVKPEGMMEPEELAEWKGWKISHPLPPPDLSLFNACFRIHREACEAAGRHIPLVAENVRGAQPWVGRSAAAYGSYHLWGNVPALMPITGRRGGKHGCVDGIAGAGATNFHRDACNGGRKTTDRNFHHFAKTGESLRSFNGAEMRDGVDGQKTAGIAFQRDGHSHTRHLTNQAESDGVKHHATGADWFDGKPDKMLGHQGPAAFGSKSNARKAASAMIARIPLNLARWIGYAWWPEDYDRPNG